MIKYQPEDTYEISKIIEAERSEKQMKCPNCNCSSGYCEFLFDNESFVYKEKLEERFDFFKSQSIEKNKPTYLNIICSDCDFLIEGMVFDPR